MSDTGFTEFQPHSINSQEIASQGYGMAPAGVKDDGKIVGFFYKAEKNNQKSQSAGAPVYDNVIMVSVQNPGEKDCIKRPVREEDKYRWPRQWEAFSKGRKYVADGTPLEQLFPTEPNIVAAINEFNIQTVQQLANLSGDAISRGGIGFGNWVEKAKKYLSTAASGAEYHKIEAQLRAKDERIAALEKTVNDLAAQMQNAMRLQPQHQMPQAGYDVQAQMTANSMAERYPAPQTVQMPTMTQAPDLSAAAWVSSSSFANYPDGTQVSTTPSLPIAKPKRGGRPKGSKNKPKETT